MFAKSKNIILSSKTALSGNGHNILVLGCAGSGKGRNYVLPNLLQFHGSYIVTDICGCFYEETAKAFRERGYQIQVFDTKSAKEEDIQAFDPTSITHEPTILYILLTWFEKEKTEFVPKLLKKIHDSIPHNPVLPVHFVLDELANIGHIPDLWQWLAINEPNVYHSLIFQGIYQLQNMYPERWPSIIKTCDTILFLGSHEHNTVEFLRECIQKKTIISKRKFSILKHRSKTKDEHLDIDETIMGLSADNCIILTKGNPWKVEPKFNPKDHPNYTSTTSYSEASWQ